MKQKSNGLFIFHWFNGFTAGPFIFKTDSDLMEAFTIADSMFELKGSDYAATLISDVRKIEKIEDDQFKEATIVMKNKIKVLDEIDPYEIEYITVEKFKEELTSLYKYF